MTSWCDVMRWLRPLMLLGCKGDRLERPAGWLFGGRQLLGAGLGATQSSAAPAVQEHPRATRAQRRGRGRGRHSSETRAPFHVVITCT